MPAIVQHQREIGSFCGRHQANAKPIVVHSTGRICRSRWNLNSRLRCTEMEIEEDLPFDFAELTSAQVSYIFSPSRPIFTA